MTVVIGLRWTLILTPLNRPTDDRFLSIENRARRTISTECLQTRIAAEIMAKYKSLGIGNSWIMYSSIWETDRGNEFPLRYSLRFVFPRFCVHLVFFSFFVKCTIFLIFWKYPGMDKLLINYIRFCFRSKVTRRRRR